jgi:hypothetical protein
MHIINIYLILSLYILSLLYIPIYYIYIGIYPLIHNGKSINYVSYGCVFYNIIKFYIYLLHSVIFLEKRGKFKYFSVTFVIIIIIIIVINIDRNIIKYPKSLRSASTNIFNF